MPEITLTARHSPSALDTRRGVVRLHPEVLDALGLRQWDAVRLTGARVSSAIAAAADKAGPTGVVLLDDVLVPWERVFLAGEHEEGGFLTSTYATHHRHSCIGARAGFGDLLIGAGALMIEANGLDTDRTAISATPWWI